MKKIILTILSIIFILSLIIILYTLNYIPHKKYTNEDFNIKTYISKTDKDNDGIDDQTDILNNVRDYIKTNPKYKSKYYATGYPNDEYGVCTDVVAFGLQGAGYDLMNLVNEHIKSNRNLYDIDVIDKNIDDIKLKNLINKSLKNIEIDYKNITDVYIRSASAGLSLSVVIHEIEKIIAELKSAIKDEESTEHVKNLVQDLSRVTDGYASVIKSKKQSLVNVSDLIDALFNVKYRLKVHEIEVVSSYRDKDRQEIIKCASNLVIGTIMNLVDNSIYWLEYSHIVNKKMYFDVSLDYEGFITIIVADNGYGFTLPTDQVVKPFVTDRVGGMGLGLHLADEIMKSSEGRLVFPDKGDVYLPEEFNGAVIGLSFPITKE